MNAEQPRAEHGALDAARAAIAHLDSSRHPEDVAADLLDAWRAVEHALRDRVGGSHAAGVALVREARQQQGLSFEQANALAAFHAVYERTREAGYQPTSADVDVARQALAALEAVPAPAGADSATPAAVLPADEPPPAPRRPAPPPFPDLDFTPGEDLRRPKSNRSRRGVWIALLALVAAGLIGGAAYYWFGGPRRDAVMNRAIGEFDAGQTDSAGADFRRVLLIDPSYALAHVYLSRIARNAGNLAAADAQLQLALTADPTNAVALREMGALLFTNGRYDLARRFYVRAVSANPEDAASMGFLGCTLIRLGRIDEGERWITRAGPGVWTKCVGAATPPDTLQH